MAARLRRVGSGAAGRVVDRQSQHQQPGDHQRPGAVKGPGARSFADLPGGHSEGYDDTFKQLFRRFYASIADPAPPPEYPTFADGLRGLVLLEAELESNQAHGWVDVPQGEAVPA